MTTTKGAPLTRPLNEIATEIAADWPAALNPGTYDPALGFNVGQHWANPYLVAMLRIHSTDLGARYFEDDAASVVSYFLSNATGWRGETARRVKAELNAATADYYAKRRAAR